MGGCDTTGQSEGNAGTGLVVVAIFLDFWEPPAPLTTTNFFAVAALTFCVEGGGFLALVLRFTTVRFDDVLDELLEGAMMEDYIF